MHRHPFSATAQRKLDIFLLVFGCSYLVNSLTFSFSFLKSLVNFERYKMNDIRHNSLLTVFCAGTRSILLTIDSALQTELLHAGTSKYAQCYLVYEST